ncbi:MAG TPA: polyphosphate kinase 1 [Gemmataceae bacterium]|nr:polyphosphate kinase 1 [Gemmataceae bacterium]
MPASQVNAERTARTNPTVPAPAGVNGTPQVALDDPSLYINRELSWLEFNRRVLEEAQDPQVPLLERLKFLAIVGSNLDEFFMVRVGGLQQKVQAGIQTGSGADRMPPTEQLERISKTVRDLMAAQYQCLTQEVLPALEKEGIVLRGLKDLAEADRVYLGKLFRKEIFPVLTPLAYDPGHPFPHLLNKSLNLAVMLQRPGHDSKIFAVVQVPAVLPRFVQLPTEKGHVFTALETVIRMHLPELFPGMELPQATVFRVSRNSEYEIDDDEVEDLLKTIEEEVRKRRRSAPVRLEIETGAPPDIEQFLKEALGLQTQDVYRFDGLLDLTGLFQIYGVAGYPHLRDPQFTPQQVLDFAQAPTLWTAIRARDILVHHPYESFAHVVDFIEAAASDDRVLAIKQTLYRTGSDSPVVRALQRAADSGKSVTALIELKARLDEERNIVWARELEKAGVHVVFGFIGLKTHCKVALVVRREEDGIRRYVHLSTGNYNPQTARIYTDLGFFTCNPDFCEDVSALFNYLTGCCELPHWRKLVVAPSRLQTFMLEKIEQEAAQQAAGRGGRIIAKINGLLEPVIVQALYRASQAGVRIDVVCRGICALRPGIPGVSDNIRVVSIVDRYLEHSRIFYFGNGGDPQVYVGSADWMDRNLSRRVEVVWPVEQADLKQRLIQEISAVSLADNVKARELLADGSHRRVTAPPGQPRLRSQERFMELAAQNNLARRLIDMPAPAAPLPEPRQPSEPRRRQRQRV